MPQSATIISCITGDHLLCNWHFYLKCQDCWPYSHNEQSKYSQISRDFLFSYSGGNIWIVGCECRGPQGLYTIQLPSFSAPRNTMSDWLLFMYINPHVMCDWLLFMYTNQHAICDTCAPIMSSVFGYTHVYCKNQHAECNWLFFLCTVKQGSGYVFLPLVKVICLCYCFHCHYSCPLISTVVCWDWQNYGKYMLEESKQKHLIFGLNTLL